MSVGKVEPPGDEFLLKAIECEQRAETAGERAERDLYEKVAELFRQLSAAFATRE